MGVRYLARSKMRARNTWAFVFALCAALLKARHGLVCDATCERDNSSSIQGRARCCPRRRAACELLSHTAVCGPDLDSWIIVSLCSGTRIACCAGKSEIRVLSAGLQSGGQLQRGMYRRQQSRETLAYATVCFIGIRISPPRCAASNGINTGSGI